MRARAVDLDGDWTFGKGQNDYRKNILKVEQSIATRINSFLNDCFFATNDGIDWLNLLGGKNDVAIGLAVNTTLLNTDGVNQVLDFELGLDASRNLTVRYKVDTIFGIITNEVSIIAGTSLTLESGDVLVTEDGEPIIT